MKANEILKSNANQKIIHIILSVFETQNIIQDTLHPIFFDNFNFFFYLIYFTFFFST